MRVVGQLTLQQVSIRTLLANPYFLPWNMLPTPIKKNLVDELTNVLLNEEKDYSIVTYILQHVLLPEDFYLKLPQSTRDTFRIIAQQVYYRHYEYERNHIFRHNYDTALRLKLIYHTSEKIPRRIRGRKVMGWLL